MYKDQPIFWMLVGLPGSGKSQWAEKFGRNEGTEWDVYSSDEIRQELYGDDYICTPKENGKVFQLMARRTKESLRAGRNVVYDATNLSKRKRMGLLKELRKIPCWKFCKLFMTSVERCVEHNEQRERAVPADVINRMYKNFQPPHKHEGWDYISLEFDYDVSQYGEDWLRNRTKDYDQQNSHHSLDLWDHLKATQDYVSEKSTSFTLFAAAHYHDIGKLKTKEIDTETGEARYYQHHCVSAYDCLLYMESDLLNTPMAKRYETQEINRCFTDTFLDISNLVYYHMHPYMSWKTSTKAEKRDRILLGEQMYQQVLLLHEADEAAH